MNAEECAVLTTAMRLQGIRRLLLLSGDDDWTRTQLAGYQAQLPGDWLWVGESDSPQCNCPASQARELLGREFQHAVFDARKGLNAEALAIIAGTLKPASWLVMLVPAWSEWAQQSDQDSLRWTEGEVPVASTHFVQRLQSQAERDADVVCLRQDRSSVSCTPLPHYPLWKEDSQQQQRLLHSLLQAEPGITALIAPRGRGKSALAGMLIAQWPGKCLVTAPARVSIDVLERFAMRKVDFIAPDNLLMSGEHHFPEAEWLIVDEAAAIPAPLLYKLTRLYPRVLLMTTQQGYEGTGRGFLLKLCARLPAVSIVALTTPQRWAENDPLERFINQLLLFEDSIPVSTRGPLSLSFLHQSEWKTDESTFQALYRMLAYAHYRTTPLDLRRMMDAPGMHFCVLRQDNIVQGGIWMVEEGNIAQPLAEAVWAGLRRPRGNLVAQSLAAHAGFPEAAQLRSRRIARIAVMPALRRQGAGKMMVSHCLSTEQDTDYFSVSFGFTDELWSFWRACGFQLIRIGNKPEASSGCCTAMAIFPLSAAAIVLCQRATARLARDASFRTKYHSGVICHHDGYLNEDDWQALAGFAWALRSREASETALWRLLVNHREMMPLLSAAIEDDLSVALQCQRSGLTGRKALLQAWREEVQKVLSVISPARSDYWQRMIDQIRQSSLPGAG